MTATNNSIIARGPCGMGINFAKAALWDGNAVVAMARNINELMIVAIRLRYWCAAIGVAAFLGAGAGHAENVQSDLTGDAVRVRIVIGGTALAATLENNAASRDLAARLPLELTLKDYHGIEKIADLPFRLTTEGAPEGIDPDVGDITYFAPWGNLALFYRDFGYARGLIRLGRIDGSVEVLEGDGPLTARIERVDQPD